MASNPGIIGWKLYVPSTYVSQTRLEEYDGVSSGKYTKGLGQTSMSFAEPCEDIVSMMLTATQSLLDDAGVDPKDVGRLEVGTETLVDKSKATKTSLMRLFGEHGDIEGVDTINACYGGTNALFNCLHWMSSPAWDGRYAIVVCGDIAVYEPGPARPTGGAGVVAMLLGPEAPVELSVSEPRATHMEDVYDFYKPIGAVASEYPKVDGHLSNECYHRAIDRCIERLARKWARVNGGCAGSLDRNVDGSLKERECTETPPAFDVRDFQHAIFHHPYGKLVQKSYCRFIWNQHKLYRNVDPVLDPFLQLPEHETYGNKALDKACLQALNGDYESKVFPSMRLGQEVGNIYTGSLYMALMALVNHGGTDLDGQRALLFSYGSGSAATMFSARFNNKNKSLEKLRDMGDIERTLAARQEVDPEEFSATLKRREEVYGTYPIDVPRAASLKQGTYFLRQVDTEGRRAYGRAFSTLRLARRFLRR